jgi:hypothetical protein
MAAPKDHIHPGSEGMLASQAGARRVLRARIAVCLAAAAAAVVAPAAFAQEQITQTLVGQDLVVSITQPDVRVASKSYPAIVFHSGDSITVTAGGCVQTGGHGKTWKSYVYPSGPSSDRLYHGLIQIPGATLGLVRLRGVVGRALAIPPGFLAPPGQTLHLTLGYEDDGYGDNGYYKHDNGTENQCAGPGGGPAWLKLVIHHGSSAVSLAPFDLTSTAADENGLPLNPLWGKQVDPHQPGLPGQALCSTPWKAPCTNQSPHIMDLPSPLDPLHPLNFLCAASGSLGRHVNWGIATYTGSAVWDEHSTGIRGDDDYNINIWREDQAAYTQENPDFVHTEFDSDETIDHFSSKWWSQFHSAVDHGNPHDMIDGHDIIEIGVIGLDCAHSCGSEIHPVLALALHVSDDPADDQWAIFARNSGDEGFCSHDSVVAETLTTVYLTLPAPAGATGVAATDATAFDKTLDQIQITTFPLLAGSVPTALVVRIDLGDPNRAPMVNGELHLRWTMAQGASARLSRRVVRHAPVGAAAAQSAGPEPEERFAQAVAALPEASRQKLLQLNAMKAAAPSWLPAHPVHLASPPGDFRSRAFAGRREALTARTSAGLGRITVVPNQQKQEYNQKLGEILKEASPPPH